MNIENAFKDMLKDDIYDLWNLYETLRNNVEKQIDTIHNHSNCKDRFVMDSYISASTNVDRIKSRLKEAAFTKIGILLGMGYMPNKDSVGKDYVIYEIYANHRERINHIGIQSTQENKNIDTIEIVLPLASNDIIRKSFTKEALFFIEFIQNIKYLDHHLRELECIKENMQYYDGPKDYHLDLTNTINDVLNETKNKLYDALWLIMLRKCDIRAHGYGGDSIRNIYLKHKEGVSEYIKKLISDDVIKRYTEVFDTEEKKEKLQN